MSDLIPRVRSFHRTVTQRIGTLSHRYLGRDRPLAESRLLFEIGTEGATVRELRARLGLDAGFVSRMLRSLEEEGLVTTVRLADEDGRVRFARLSRSGRAELRRLNELSDELVRSILEPLGPEQSKRLVAAMAEVERLLKVSAIEFVVEEPRTREAVWCLKQYYRELRDRSPKAVDPDGGMSGGAGELVVHARTKAQAYKPPAYWERIADIRAAVKIPVVANGEIWTVEDARRCLRRRKSRG